MSFHPAGSPINFHLDKSTICLESGFPTKSWILWDKMNWATTFLKKHGELSQVTDLSPIFSQGGS